MINFSSWLKLNKSKSVRLVAKGIKHNKSEAGPTDRQERILGFEQEKLESTKIALVGAGGLGGEIAEGLAMKGIGHIEIFDGDTVSFSNFNRQKFFREDIYKNKAISLAKFLLKRAVKRTVIIAHPFMFQKALEKGMNFEGYIIICAPDNDRTRIDTAKYCYERNISAIFTGLSLDANTGYVFIQEQGKACFGCAFPNALSDEREPCPNSPAVTDIDKAIAGHVLFALDTLLMPERRRNWNYRQIFLCGFAPDVALFVNKRNDCQMCGGI